MTSQQTEKRPFALVVGRDTRARARVGQALLDRGYSIVMCSGPPGCALAHEDSCALVQRADVAVMLSPWQEPHGGFFLRECATFAHKAVFAWAPPFAIPDGSVIVDSMDPTRIASAVDAAVRTRVA